MVTLQIDEALAGKLEALAKEKGQSIQGLLTEIVEQFEQKPPAPEAQAEVEEDDLDSYIGMFDADIDDLSVRAREELHAYFRDDKGRFKIQQRADI